MLDGLDVHLALYPVGALLGDAFLLELVGELQPIGIDDEGLLLGLAGIESVDEGRLTEQEIKVVDAVEALLERVVGVNGEVGGDNRQPRTVLNFSFEEISYSPACMIIAKSRVARGIGMWLRLFHLKLSRR